MSKNKVTTLHVKKKWINKHHSLRSTRASYGDWTPPWNVKGCKKRHKDKVKFMKNQNEDWIEYGWIDYEIERNFDLNEIITETDDTENDIWICPSC